MDFVLLLERRDLPFLILDRRSLALALLRLPSETRHRMQAGVNELTQYKYTLALEKHSKQPVPMCLNRNRLLDWSPLPTAVNSHGRAEIPSA